MRKPRAQRSILIFGGAGFIGCNWAHRLLATTNATVHVFDNLSRSGVEHNLNSLQRAAGASNRLKITIGDTRDSALVRTAVAEASEIYHFAAQVAVTSSVEDPRSDFEVNVGGTFNILEAARIVGHRPFLLFTSTNKVYGHLGEPKGSSRLRHIVNEQDCVPETQPLDFYSPYGCSKGAADQYVHDYGRIYGLPTVVFRMSCIAGPNQFGNEDQGWVAHFLYSALQGRPLCLYGDGRQVRDVLCVSDLMRAFEFVYLNPSRTAGEIYNVGGGLKNAVSLLELIDEVEHLTGNRLHYRRQQPRPGDQPVYVTDFSKLEAHTSWRPKVGVRGILETIYEWWREHQEYFGAPTKSAPALHPLVGDVSELAS